MLRRRLSLASLLVLGGACGGGGDLSVEVPAFEETTPGAEGRPNESSTDAGNESSVSTGSSDTDAPPPPGDLPQTCGEAIFIYNQPITRQLWLVDRSFSTLLPVDHDDDPTTADVIPQDRIEAALEWVLPNYPADNGCGSVHPAIMFYPGEGTAAPPSAQSCEVAPPTMTVLDSSPAQVLEAWESRPPAGGANAMRSAIELALTKGLGGFETWDTNRVVVFSGSPPACGPGSEDHDASLGAELFGLTETYGVQFYLVNGGAHSGIASSEVDGAPDDVDYQDAWASLYSASFVVVSIDDPEALTEYLLAQTPSTEASCFLEFGGDDNPPLPNPSDLTPTVYINDVAYHELQLSYSQCGDLEDGGGFIWLDPSRTELRLCGDACDAVQCENLPPFPENGLRVEMPYLCGD